MLPPREWGAQRLLVPVKVRRLDAQTSAQEALGLRSSSARVAQAVPVAPEQVAPVERLVAVPVEPVPVEDVLEQVDADVDQAVVPLVPLAAVVLRASLVSRSGRSAKSMKCARRPVLAAYRSLEAMAQQPFVFVKVLLWPILPTRLKC